MKLEDVFHVIELWLQRGSARQTNSDFLIKLISSRGLLLTNVTCTKNCLFWASCLAHLLGLPLHRLNHVA
jgi:hypothetical protein